MYIGTNTRTNRDTRCVHRTSKACCSHTGKLLGARSAVANEPNESSAAMAPLPAETDNADDDEDDDDEADEADEEEDDDDEADDDEEELSCPGCANGSMKLANTACGESGDSADERRADTEATPRVSM